MGGDSKCAHAPSTILMESYLQEHRGVANLPLAKKRALSMGVYKNDKRTAIAVDTSGWSKSKCT